MALDTYSFLPDRAYAQELVRPWKLVTFCMAMMVLLYGAIFLGIKDWDIGVTLLMGGLTYLMAPWSVYVVLSAIRYRPDYWYLQILAALIAGVFVVDWVYMAYHGIVGNPTYRDANFWASAPLYFLAGAVWLYRGSAKQFLENLKRVI